MLWERKTQLARETIAAVDTEVGQGEIKSMKTEIHRMDLKFKELKKAQERLMREMEYSVVRRGTIENRNVTSNTQKESSKVTKIYFLGLKIYPKGLTQTILREFP